MGRGVTTRRVDAMGYFSVQVSLARTDGNYFDSLPDRKPIRRFDACMVADHTPADSCPLKHLSAVVKAQQCQLV